MRHPLHTGASGGAYFIPTPGEPVKGQLHVEDTGSDPQPGDCLPVVFVVDAERPPDPRKSERRG